MPPDHTAALDPRAVNRPPVSPGAPAADAGPRAGVRAEGFAIDVQGLEIGLRSLAVPVRDALGSAAARLGSRLSPTR